MGNPRLERLRRIEAAAHGRWRVGRKVGRTLYAQVSDEPSDDDVLSGLLDTREDALLAATALDILPTTIDLLEGVLERHHLVSYSRPDGIRTLRLCKWCRRAWPCPDAEAALAALDRIGDNDD